MKPILRAIDVCFHCPYDCVCIVVDNDRDVLVVFFVAGLVNADIYETVKPSGTLRLDVVQGSVDVPSDCFLVNTHILGDGASGQVCGELPDSKAKVLCKAAAGVCPWDI